MNLVVLSGRLAGDTDLGYTPNTQTACCKFTIAVDKEKKSETSSADFIRITVFGKQAESCDRYLEKGREVIVVGKVSTGSYKNRNGDTVYTIDFIADRVEFGSKKNNSTTTESKPSLAEFMQNKAEQDEVDSFNAAEDDIPF